MLIERERVNKGRMRKWLFGNVHQSWLVVFLCVGIIVGMIIGLVFRVRFFKSPIWIVVSLVLIMAVFIKTKGIMMIFGLAAGIIMAFVRISGELLGEDYIMQLYDAEVLVSGVISGDPETDEKGTTLKITDLKFSEEKIESAGSIYVSLRKNEELARGDQIALKGKMAEGFGTYAGYMYQPRLMHWARPEPGDLVLKVRNWFAKRVEENVPEPQVRLGLSYLLGMKTGLSDEFAEQLRTVGLTHIVVASGAHLAILVEVARKIFGKMSRMFGVICSVIFVVFFMCMVGWTPSIMRAGLMTILTLIAWYSGRKMAPWRVILMVGALTLMLEPNFLMNMGWQLSFASYAGIMVLGPRLTSYFYGKRKPGWIASVILATIAATIMTLPIILYYYGQVSLISVIANLLILPTLPYVMGATFLAGIVAGVPVLASVLGWITTRMLDFHIAVVGWFGGMEQFLVNIPPYQIWVFGIYGVVIGWIGVDWYMKRRKRKRIEGLAM